MPPKLTNFSALVGNNLWCLDGTFQFDFDATPDSVLAVLQNVYSIWSTPLGTQPLFRTFGQDMDWIDLPGNLATFQLQTAFLLACAKWEPRATFSKIVFSMDPAAVVAGVYTLYVELSIDLSVSVNAALFAPPSPATTRVVDANFAGASPVVQPEALTL